MIIKIDKMAKNNRIIGNDSTWQELQNRDKTLYRIKCNIIWGAIVALLLAGGFGSFVLYEISSNDVIMAISNFATILSIILSISSIAYSYSTSHDTARQFAEIDKTVARMKENNEEIMRNNIGMQKLVFEISKEVHSIHENGFFKRNIDSKANNDKDLNSSDIRAKIPNNNPVLNNSGK